MLKLRNSQLLRTQSYINGGWFDSDSGRHFDVLNPATGKVLSSVADMGVVETRRAIEAAHRAQKAWRQYTAKQRSVVLRRWYGLMMENKQDLAAILTAEQGKPLAEAEGEILYGASYIEWFAEEAKRVYGDVIAPPSNDKRLLIIKQPVGVVASITPWNFW